MRLHLAALAVFIATPTLAQVSYVEVADNAPVAGFGINADLADDLDVLDSTGRKIGEVEEILGQTRDAAEAVAVDFEDSASEFGAEDRVIPLTAFSFNGSALVLADGTTVQDMPIWQD